MDIDFPVVEGNIRSENGEQNELPLSEIDTSNIDFVENFDENKKIKKKIFKDKFPNVFNRLNL